jgi:signal transduction histidine kinase
MARCYYAQNNFPDAISTAEEGYRLSLLGKNKNFTQEICSLLGDIYASASNLSKSNHFLRLSSLYKDSIMNQSISQSLESRIIQSRLTKEQSEKKVMALSLQQKEEQLYWQRLIILFVGIALFIITILLLLIRKTNIVRKQANAQLKIKNEQLENLNREISGLIQTIVHDLKSPFNTLQGIFSLMEIENISVEAKDLLSHGKKAVINGQEIIQQLLTIREAEENILTIKPTSFESKELVDDVVGDYTSTARSKEITIDVEAANEIITTDRIILRRVLDNLLSNAIKFTPKQGHVSIASKKENGDFVLEIADNGPGFSSRDMDKIFGKFQRLSARPTGGESSNGLGLAIVDSLLKKISGNISLKTEPGKGASFTVKIPN